MREFVINRKFRLDHPLPLRHVAQLLWQMVIALRADNQIHQITTPKDFRAFGLRHAARHRDGQRVGAGAALRFQITEHAQFGIDLLGRLFADMTSVEHNQISVFGSLGYLITFRAQHIGHALRIISIHLAAKGLDEQFTLRDHRNERCVRGSS